jgi:2-iminobutanoate/2-iminopropanoate deaminase
MSTTAAASHIVAGDKTLRTTVMIEEAVKPAGYYSHAAIANGLVYVSGQGPVDPQTGEMRSSFADQVRQALRYVNTILLAVGTDLTQAVKVNAYLSDATRFAEFDAVYREFFSDEPPARTTVACQLSGIMVEIDCTAVLPASPADK